MLSEDIKVLTWGYSASNNFVIKNVAKKNSETIICSEFNSVECKIEIPFTDDASIENAITCCCVLLHLGIRPEIIAGRMRNIHPVNMRLELKKGINQSDVPYSFSAEKQN